MQGDVSTQYIIQCLDVTSSRQEHKDGSILQCQQVTHSVNNSVNNTVSTTQSQQQMVTQIL